MIEMGVRGVMDAVSGTGDKDKKDAAYWLRKFAQTSVDNQAATVPVLRDIWRPVSRSIFEPDAKMFGNSAKMTSALDSFVRLSDAGVTASHVVRRDGQRNVADFVRDGGRALNGLPVLRIWCLMVSPIPSSTSSTQTLNGICVSFGCYCDGQEACQTEESRKENRGPL